MTAARAHQTNADLPQLLEELLLWTATLTAHPLNRVARKRVSALLADLRPIVEEQRSHERLIAALDAAEAAAREAHGYRADLEG